MNLERKKQISWRFVAQTFKIVQSKLNLGSQAQQDQSCADSPGISAAICADSKIQKHVGRTQDFARNLFDFVQELGL